MLIEIQFVLFFILCLFIFSLRFFLKITSVFFFLSIFFSFFLSSAAFFYINHLDLVFIISGLWSFTVLLSGFFIRDSARSRSVFVFSLFSIISGWGLICSSSNFLIIFFFETMTLSALSALRLTTKNERGTEAITEMYIWAILGSFFLLASLFFSYFSFINIVTSNKFSLLLSLIGFSIKIPLWPFSSWLLKAHVEASTEFSIFLSGFLVKFGVIGLVKFIHNFNSSINLIFISFSFIGIIEATIRLLSQVDLKRIIALLTIIETNWLTLCLLSGNSYLFNIGCSLVLIHSMTTTLEFSVVEFIYKRHGTRNLNEISGISLSFPVLSFCIWLVCLTTIGLPGTSIFTFKILFIANLFKFSPFLAFIISILFFIILPCFFVRIWSFCLGGKPVFNNQSTKKDLNKEEFLFIIIPFLISIVFGFYPSLLS